MSSLYTHIPRNPRTHISNNKVAGWRWRKFYGEIPIQNLIILANGGEGGVVVVVVDVHPPNKHTHYKMRGKWENVDLGENCVRILSLFARKISWIQYSSWRENKLFSPFSSQRIFFVYLVEIYPKWKAVAWHPWPHFHPILQATQIPRVANDRQCFSAVYLPKLVHFYVTNVSKTIHTQMQIKCCVNRVRW